MKKIILAKTNKFTYDRRTKKLVQNWGVLDNIIETASHAHYVQVSNRLNTFRMWPCDYFLRGEDLAEAGFFYYGKSDVVTCFSCNLELGNWRPFDDVYKQHAIFSWSCKYLAFKKGLKYIQK